MLGCAMEVDPLPLFGIPLDLAIARTQLYPQLPVPAIVVRCIEFLDSTGLHDVGLYRIPGASTAVHQLKHEFEMHGDVDLLAIPSSTTATSPTYQPTRHPHVVATVLKHYLRELPCLFPPLPPELDTSTSSDPSSPLLFAAPMSTSLKHEEIGPLALSSQKTHLSSSSSVTTLTPSWETWIPLFFPTLPKPTQCVLLMVLTHLTRVAFFSDTNKMTASNLALIFSPTFHVPSSLLLYLLTHEEWYACSTLKN
ncbi:hypothetical protein HMI54_005287 [Coelomomyces lativittatus]|nr:hypothetical protein HMI54_005287 [Coelomomyces lativittatus]